MGLEFGLGLVLGLEIWIGLLFTGLRLRFGEAFEGGFAFTVWPILYPRVLKEWLTGTDYMTHKYRISSPVLRIVYALQLYALALVFLGLERESINPKHSALYILLK